MVLKCKKKRDTIEKSNERSSNMKFEKSTLENQTSELYNIEIGGLGKAAGIAVAIMVLLVGVGLIALYA
jgi:ABC-type transporter Mla maintaining outer membrane lipid asymmetry ATPase subunit MlaF